MKLRIITLAAAAGALALAACSDNPPAPTDAATDAGADAAVTVPDAGAMTPVEPEASLPGDMVTPVPVEGATGPGSTPPTLPTEPDLVSPTSSPPPR